MRDEPNRLTGGLEVQRQYSNLEAYAVHNPHPTQEQWAYWTAKNSYERSFHKEIFGLRQRTFWLIVFLAAIVTGATVGGAVGGSIAVQKAKSPAAATPTATSTLIVQAQATGTSTSTALSATYTAPSPQSLSNIPIACDPSTSLLSTWDNSAFFRCIPTTDLRDGDITGIIAYSLQNCIDACATMNKVTGMKQCIAVSVGSDLSQQYRENSGANCWLKGNGTRSVNSGVFTVAKLCTDSNCGNVVEVAED